MAGYEQVRRSVWTEPEMVRLGRWARQVNVWTWTNDHLTPTGILWIARETIAHETGLSAREIDHGLDELTEAGLLWWSPDGRMFIVRRVDRVPGMSGNSRQKIPVLQQLGALDADDAMRLAFVHAYRDHPSMRHGSTREGVTFADLCEQSEIAEDTANPDTPSKGYPYPCICSSSIPTPTLKARRRTRARANATVREEDVTAVWTAFLEAVPTARRQRLDTHRGVIETALAVATVAECSKAVRIIGLDPWFRERGRLQIRYALHGRHDEDETDRARIERMCDRVDSITTSSTNGNGHLPARDFSQYDRPHRPQDPSEGAPA